jgi:hypothetical protein
MKFRTDQPVIGGNGFQIRIYEVYTSFDSVLQCRQALNVVTLDKGKVVLVLN